MTDWIIWGYSGDPQFLVRVRREYWSGLLSEGRYYVSVKAVDNALIGGGVTLFIRKKLPGRDGLVFRDKTLNRGLDRICKYFLREE